MPSGGLWEFHFQLSHGADIFYDNFFYIHAKIYLDVFGMWDKTDTWS